MFAVKSNDWDWFTIWLTCYFRSNTDCEIISITPLFDYIVAVTNVTKIKRTVKLILKFFSINFINVILYQIFHRKMTDERDGKKYSQSFYNAVNSFHVVSKSC